jgi:hypothetical protein
MQFLIDFAERDEEFQEILGRATEYDTVQGMVLDIDRLWLQAWHLRERWGDDRLNAWFDNWLHDLRRWPAMWMPELPDKGGPTIFSRPLTKADVEGWQPNHWRYLQDRMGASPKELPLVVKVCLRPRLSEEDKFPSVEGLRPTEGRLRIELETRSRAQLGSDPRKSHAPLPGGVSIGVGTGDYGTLGVILTDGASVHYGLTCSHVAGAAAKVKQPSQRDSTSTTMIGQTVASTVLSVCPVGTKCNPWSGVVPNDVDLSLIEIDPGSVATVLEVLDIGPLTGIMPRASISTSQAVEVMGRTSRHNALQVGGLAAWFNFQHNGNEYCFHNLFEVESPYGTAGVIRLGDSGAPVCTPDATGTAWAGLIVGRDAFKGYAMYSQTIDEWLVKKGFRLDVK